MNEQEIYGLHAVMALLNNPQRHVKHVFINQDRKDQRLLTVLQNIQSKAIPVTPMTAAKMATKFPDAAHQGIVALASALPECHEKDLPALLARLNHPPLILILDGITDPHNLGACLRSADAAGVDCVIIPKDKSASINAVASKVACGAAESIPVIRVTNLVRSMETIKELGIWIYGAASEAQETLYDLRDTHSPIALVLGAEGEGLRRLTREHCDGLFAIPMLGSVTSLNVSVATGVTLFEIVRQRGHFQTTSADLKN